MTGHDWRARAACRDHDPELWFPLALDKGGPVSRHHASVVAAVDICRRCPVTSQCLDWATSTGQAYGVWGATTPHERRHLDATATAPAVTPEVAPTAVLRRTVVRPRQTTGPCGWCGTKTANPHGGGIRYCSDAHRRYAKSARERERNTRYQARKRQETTI